MDESSRNGRGPQRRGLTIGLVLVLALGLVVAAIWMLGGGPLLGSGEQADVVSTAPPGTPAESRFDAPVPAPRDGTSEAAQPETALPEAGTPQVTPLQTGAETVPEEWRDIRGVTVRAADGSPVGAATVIALLRDVATNDLAERARAQSDTDGNFTLSMPRDVETFRVLAPAPGRPRDDPRPGNEVRVRIEWAHDDPTASEVRLVLETGWRLDLRVLDGAGQPRGGVVASCGACTATSDPDGRCVLLDLPAGEPTVTLTLQTAPGARSVTETVGVPGEDRLIRELELTVP